MTKIVKKPEKKQKLVSFCVFVFVVPKHIAHKMVMTSNFVSQKDFNNFYKNQPQTNQNKKSKKKHAKLHHFEPKNSKN